MFGIIINIDDSQSSARHLMGVARLAESLAQKKIAIYEHEFHYVAFGSWKIVAGRRGRMLRFKYDGKDSYLSYCDASIKPQSHLDLQHERFATDMGESPFSFLRSVPETEFPIEKA